MPEVEAGTAVENRDGGSKGIFEVLGALCSLKGGFAELEPDGRLHTLLPAESALPAGLEEEMVLSLSAGSAGSLYAGYGSDTLGAFSRLLSDEGDLAEFAILPPHHIKSSGFEKLLQDTLVPVNGLIRLRGTANEFTPYLLFNVAYVGQADEKRQGMVSLWMNGVTGATPVDMDAALAWHGDRIPVEDAMRKFPCLDASIPRAAMQARSADLIRAELEPWRKSLERRRKRDEDRVRGYFQGMASEIRKRAEKKQLAGDELIRETARAKATEREAERKLDDLKERYALRVKARLHSCLRVYVPTVHLHCELVRKRIRRDIVAIYNPFSKCLEPLRCETSYRTVRIFELGDENAAIKSL